MQLAFQRDSSVHLKDGQITKKPSFKLKFENPNSSLLADTARQRDLLSAHFSWILQSRVLHAPSLLRSFENHLSVSCFSTTAHVKTVDLSGVSKNTVESEESRKTICALLNRYGVNAKQIDCAVRRTPGILKCKEQDIVPKLEFFLSRGASKELLGAMVARDSFWLMRRLDDTIIPNYKFIKSILLTDKRAIQTIKSNLWLLQRDLERLYSPNIKVLEELQVPESSIRYLVGFYPEAVFCGGEFEETVSEVLEMGFDPLKITFVLALHAVSGNVNKTIRDRCYEIYSKWGWSKEDICMAFRKNPNCMLMSQKKLEGILEFLVHKMGSEAKIIAQNAAIMNQSLEKRIIPRFSVIQVLLSEGLICKQPRIPTVLAHNDELFLRRCVVPYKKIIPQLHDIYKGKIKLVEVDLDEGQGGQGGCGLISRNSQIGIVSIFSFSLCQNLC